MHKATGLYFRMITSSKWNHFRHCTDLMFSDFKHWCSPKGVNNWTSHSLSKSALYIDYAGLTSAATHPSQAWHGCIIAIAMASPLSIASSLHREISNRPGFRDSDEALPYPIVVGCEFGIGKASCRVVSKPPLFHPMNGRLLHLARKNRMKLQVLA